MNRLMSADLFRLKRDKVFLICWAAILSAAVLMNGVRQCRVMRAEGYQMELAGHFFRLVPALSVCVAVFTGLFLGTDHSEGALRNRLMVGHSRGRVYLAALGSALMGAMAFAGAWLAGGGAVALFGREHWHMGAGQTALFILIAIASALALASILTVAGILSEKKSTAAVVSIQLTLGLFLLSTWIYSRLQEPEMETGLVITTAGMEWGDPTPNPRYVSGTLRQVFELLMDLLPSGQMVLLSELAVSRPIGNLLASVAVTAAATLTGMALFYKKDLK